MLTASHIHQLSRSDACSLLELISESVGCRTIEQFRTIILKLKNLIAFDVATCLISKKDSSGKIASLNVFNVNYPAEWVSYYLSRTFNRSIRS